MFVFYNGSFSLIRIFLSIQKEKGDNMRPPSSYFLQQKGLIPFPLHAFAQQFSGTPNSFSFLPLAIAGRLFKISTLFHLPVYPLALHFFLQYTQSLVDIVVTDIDFHESSTPSRKNYQVYKTLSQAYAMAASKLQTVPSHLTKKLWGCIRLS